MKKLMNTIVRAATVGGVLILVTTGCDRREAERKAEQDRRSQEATITAAKVEAENAKLKAAHAEARVGLQKDLDAADRKAMSLKLKAAKTVGVQKKNADAAIAELDKRRDAAKVSMSKLGDDMSPAWDETKKAADDDVAAVGKAVDALERTLAKR